MRTHLINLLLAVSFRKISRFVACILAVAVLATTSGCGGGALGAGAQGALIGGGIGVAAWLIMPKPVVQTTPSSLDFQRVARGDQKDLQVTIRGRQKAEITIDRISISGDAFSLVGDPSVPFTIPPDGDIEITVRFQPSSEGKNTGKLEISSFVAGGKPRVLGVSLKGTGT